MSALTGFDLCSEPWVKVLGSDGEVKTLGLVDVLKQAGSLERLVFESASQSAAVQRLLLALTYRITGLDTAASAVDWQKRRNEAIAAEEFDGQAIDRYFETFANRFDLLDAERPFAQDPRLPSEGVKLAQIGKLLPDVPAGNNIPWFQVGALPESVPVADAASWLLVKLTFSPGGATGSRSGSKSSVTMGPRGRTTYFYLAENLKTSLLCNLTIPAGDPIPTWWEGDLIEVKDGQILTGYTDPVNRCLGRWRHAFLLKPSEDGRQIVGVWPSWMFNKADDNVNDPHLAYRRKEGKDGQVQLIALTADPERQLWRDLDALAVDPALKDSSSSVNWEVNTQSGELPDELLRCLRIEAFGYACGGSFNANEEGWWRSTTPQPVGGWLTSDSPTRRNAAELTGAAAALSAALGSAFGVVSAATSLDATSRRSQARSLFFAAMEQIYWDALGDGDCSKGTNRARAAALDAYEAQVKDLAGLPRFAAAVARGRHKIVAALRANSAK